LKQYSNFVHNEHRLKTFYEKLNHGVF